MFEDVFKEMPWHLRRQAARSSGCEVVSLRAANEIAFVATLLAMDGPLLSLRAKRSNLDGCGGLSHAGDDDGSGAQTRRWTSCSGVIAMVVIFGEDVGFYGGVLSG